LHLRSTGLDKEQGEAEALQGASSSLRAEKDAMCKRLIALQESLHSLEQEQQQREAGKRQLCLCETYKCLHNEYDVARHRLKI
jgi:hypothetical protein